MKNQVAIDRSNELSYQSEVVNQKMNTHVLHASSVVIAHLYENSLNYEVRIIATGYCLENFQIHVEENLLKVTGEKNVKEIQPLNRMFFKFSIHHFSRSFHLPSSVDTQRIRISFTEGILVIELPKKPTLWF